MRFQLVGIRLLGLTFAVLVLGSEHRSVRSPRRMLPLDDGLVDVLVKSGGLVASGCQQYRLRGWARGVLFAYPSNVLVCINGLTEDCGFCRAETMRL